MVLITNSLSFLVAAATGAAPKEAAKEEVKEEEADVDMGDLFGGGDYWAHSAKLRTKTKDCGIGQELLLFVNFFLRNLFLYILN